MLVTKSTLQKHKTNQKREREIRNLKTDLPININLNPSLTLHHFEWQKREKRERERERKGKEIQETCRHEIRMEKKINYMVAKMIHMHGERRKKHCKKSQEYHFYIIYKRGREGKQNPINF